MSQPSGMIDCERCSMDSFEDVDLGSLDDSAGDQVCVEPRSSLHLDSLPNDTGIRHSELGRLRVPSVEAYQQAFLPFRTDTGTPYPCNQNDLDVHSSGTFRQPNTRPFVSAMEATRDVMLHNHVTRRVPPTELVAVENLRKIVDTVEKRMDFGPDLAVKAFVDLDLLFFGGHLREHVRVQWVKARDHSSFSGPGRVWGVACYLRRKRGKCLIKLNADLHLLRYQTEDPLRTMFSTLLHQMCHAYKGVRCEYGRVKRRGHDEHFGTRLAVIHQRAMRVLGLWAIAKNELYRQYHFLPGEQTVTGMMVARVMDVVLDVDDKVAEVAEKMEAAADMVARGITAAKRWIRAENKAVEDCNVGRGEDSWTIEQVG